MAPKAPGASNLVKIMFLANRATCSATLPAPKPSSTPHSLGLEAITKEQVANNYLDPAVAYG